MNRTYQLTPMTAGLLALVSLASPVLADHYRVTDK